MRLIFSVTGALALGIAFSARAGTWRSALYPDGWQAPSATSVDFDSKSATGRFLQDFSYAGYHRGEAPIPAGGGLVYDVTQSPYSADARGVNDCTAAIQHAINDAQSAGGGIVYLPAGTYRVSIVPTKNWALRISAPHIVLRGAGADKTRILNATTQMRFKSVLMVEPFGYPDDTGWRAEGTASAISSDLKGPATQIPVTDAGIFGVGDWVVVRADATDEWVTEHGEPDWIGKGDELHGLAYPRRVLAKDATSITIDIPTRYSLKTRDHARVVKLPVSALPLTEVGLEKFGIGNVQHPGAAGWGENDYDTAGTAAYDCHQSYAISFTGVADSWVRSVSSFAPDGNTSTAHYLSNGLRFDFCRTNMVADCVFQRPQYGGGGGNGYAFRLEDSSDTLFQDCTASFTRHGYLLSEMATTGNVIYRCIDRETARYTGPDGSIVAEGRGSEHHAHFSHSNLVDSNTADSSLFLAVYRPFGTAPKHDLTASQTVFWNTQGRGDQQWEGATGDVVVASQQYGWGYVIGTRGTRNAVDVSVYYGANTSASKTAPIDFVEGAGLSDDLEPSSLYEDQVSRRLSRKIFRVSAGDSSILFPPAKTVTVKAKVTNGPPDAFVDGAASFTWSSVRAAGSVTPATASTAEATFELGGPGIYEFRLDAIWNGESSTESVVCDLRDSAETTRTVDVLASKDATIRNGPSAAVAYGAENSLQMKLSDAVAVQRQILLQFVPLRIAAADLRSAALLVTPTNTPNGYTAAIDVLDDVSWNEYATTWSNQPAGGNFTADWQGADGQSPAVDLTAAVKNLLDASGSALALRLRATTATDGDGVIAFRSKEGSAAAGPHLRMVVNAAALPAPDTPPRIKILTRSVPDPGKRAVTVRGTVQSVSPLKRMTLQVQRGRPVRCKFTPGKPRWSARVHVQTGRNKLVAVAMNAAGLSARAVAFLKTKKAAPKT